MKFHVPETPSWRLVVVLTVIFLIFVLVGVKTLGDFGDQIDTIKENQAAGEQRGYQTRAAACRVQLLLGAELDPPCLLPDVTKHYDVNEAPTTGASSFGQQRNAMILCAFAGSFGVSTVTDGKDICDGVPQLQVEATG